LVVRTAPQLDVVDARFPAGRERLHVMKLQEAPLVTAASIPADERASAVVALPDHAPHGSRNVA
jgi:hypothetical protein